MKLTEILDRGVQFEVEHNTKDLYVARFTIGKRQILFYANSDGDENEWNIVFGEVKYPDDESRSADLDYGKTGSGKEFKVFATLKNILEKFIRTKHPKAIKFSAEKTDGANRSRIYAKMFQRNLPSGWKLEKHDDMNDSTVFFQMIKEALDKPLPYTVTNKTAKFFDARFKAGDRWIDFTAQLYPKGEYWEITFEEQMERNTTTKATGSGNEFQVFATVKAIIEKFIEEYQPTRLTIDSFKGEANRTKLYNRMIAKNLPDGWKVGRDDTHPSYTTFNLTKEA